MMDVHRLQRLNPEKSEFHPNWSTSTEDKWLSIALFVSLKVETVQTAPNRFGVQLLKND
jgi:hypothetical protein